MTCLKLPLELRSLLSRKGRVVGVVSSYECDMSDGCYGLAGRDLACVRHIVSELICSLAVALHTRCYFTVWYFH